MPIIRHDFIRKCLETLKQYTPVDYRVIVIDQTEDRRAQDEAEHLSNLWIRSYRNLGFSKGMNTGIQLSQTPYIALINDDLEFLDSRWWQGIVETFEQDEKIIAVNPMSPKEGAWGYGLREETRDQWQPPEAFVTDDSKNAVYPKFADGSGMMTPESARENYDFLLNEHPRWTKDTMCDAIAMWCTIFKKEGLEKIGLLDEKFYPGGGEDYDMNCRAYSQKLRMVGSTKSWVWHHWGQSRNMSASTPDIKMFNSRPRWNNNDELWGEKFDVWGHYIDENGEKKPLKRKYDIFIDDL